MKELHKYTGIFKIVGLLVLAPLLCYMLTINKTMNMYHNLKKQNQIKNVAQTDGKERLENDMVFSDNEDVKSGAVIKTLNKHINNNSIVTDSYIPTLNYKSNGFSVYTGELVLSGEFCNLTYLLGKLEYEKRGYRIASIQYKTVSDFKKHSTRLQMTVIIQQVIRI